MNNRTLKSTILALGAAWFCAPLFAAELQLAVSGFQATTGKLFVTVFNNKKAWFTEQTVAKDSVVVADKIEEGIVEVSFVLPAGEYAVLMYQDVNDNGKMDTRRVIPIPKEPVGISNNIKPRFGPPKYKAAKFQLATDVLRLDIELQ